MRGHSGGFRPQELQRRQFQQAAATTLDHQAKAILATREFVADLSARADAAHAKIDDLRARRFWGRLRWLLTGR